MAEEQPDRLSQLPDHLLQHILHLAPCRDATTTAVLSQRWRWLWPPPTGTVKIYIPSGYIWPCDTSLSLPIIEEALATARGPVERLSFHAGEPWWSLHTIVADVLSHPACRGVQDVRLGPIVDDDDDDDGRLRLPNCNVGVFEFSLGVVVPCSALRVLHVTSCRHLTPPPGSTFPCLEVLRLRRCSVHLQSLQDMVDASPQLTALQLEYVFLITDHSPYFPQSLCCLGVTTLVLLHCCCENDEDAALEIDTPRLQHFRYKGKIDKFTLTSPPPDLRRAYIHILNCYRRDVVTCERFWMFLKNFRDTKVLKLKLDWPIDYVAALERRRIRDLLIDENQSAQSIRFSVEHLEIDAPYNPESEDVGVAIGNLLQCCPTLRDLSLTVHTADQLIRTRNRRKSQMMDFHKSIDHFRRRRERPVVSLRGDNNGLSGIPDIPGLSDRWFHFSCLQFDLKRLSLQFHMDKDDTDCVGVRLVKFFIERGMALEEIYIDGGNMKLLEHMNCKINGYPANPHQPFFKVPCVGENVASAY